MYPKSIKNLIESFKYFPGIGEKTAERLAFSVLQMEKEQVDDLSKNLINARNNIKTDMGSTGSTTARPTGSDADGTGIEFIDD